MTDTIPSRQRKQRRFRRARNSGVRLNEADAARILGMYVRGDRQHDIASYHGVDSARVSEIVKGHKFFGIAAMPERELPPTGPYVVLDRASTEQLRAALAKRVP